MKDFLQKNLNIKIISVLAAILIWLVVLNLDDPYKTQTVTVELEVENLESLSENGLQLLNSNFKRNVEIEVRGRNSVIDTVKPSDFKATIDFSRITNDGEKFIYIEGPFTERKEITLIKHTPEKIEIQLESIIRRHFPVTVNITGTPKEGYEIINMIQVPGEIELEGLESLINTVAEIKTSVDISGIENDLSVEKPCYVYDAKGQAIDTLSKGQKVNVRFEVAKNVPVFAVIQGSPAQDHIQTSRGVKPETVLVRGSAEKLGTLSAIYTEPVSIQDAQSSIEASSKLVLPDGIKLVESSSDQVLVNVNIEKLIEKEIMIEASRINLTNTYVNQAYNYDIINDSVKITIKGKKSDLDSLDSSEIRLTADVNKLMEGIHGIPVKVLNLPNATLLRADNIQIRIDKIQSYSIKASDIVIFNGKADVYKYSLNSAKIEIVFRGYSENLEKLTPEVLRPELDVKGLIEGVYSIPLSFKYPDSVTLVKGPIVQMIITKLEQDI